MAEWTRGSQVLFQVEGEGLDEKNFSGASDPYLQLFALDPTGRPESECVVDLNPHKKPEDIKNDRKRRRASPLPQMWRRLYQTEYIPHTTNPNWDRFVINMKDLCNGDVDR
jgi:hypothetical protein